MPKNERLKKESRSPTINHLTMERGKEGVAEAFKLVLEEVDALEEQIANLNARIAKLEQKK